MVRRKDTTVNMFTLLRSLNISKNELSRYLSSCLNTTFRLWLAEVRFEAAKKMMLDSPDFGNDIISAECGFSSRSYLYRMFKEKEGCSPTAWREKNVKKYVLGVSFPHEGDTFFVGMRHLCGGMRHLVSKKNTIFAP